ncbi:MAG TPA: hypothetical protein VHL31_18025 [Geminicoccus sp.]|nr:hypothetical protein [Geminicoccus sp.]HEX2528186.1 hypothetical protein [Geminicoccus sp.]
MFLQAIGDGFSRGMSAWRLITPLAAKQVPPPTALMSMPSSW